MNDPIQSNHATYFDAMKSGDVDRLVSLFSSEAILMPPNETTLFGIAEVREWFQEYFEYFKVQALADTERELTILDECIIERGAFMVAIIPVGEDSKRIRDDGRYLTIWKRESDGSWKISQSMWNSMKAVGAGTTRFMVRMMKKSAVRKA